MAIIVIHQLKKRGICLKTALSVLAMSSIFIDTVFYNMNGNGNGSKAAFETDLAVHTAATTEAIKTKIEVEAEAVPAPQETSTTSLLRGGEAQQPQQQQQQQQQQGTATTTTTEQPGEQGQQGQKISTDLVAVEEVHDESNNGPPTNNKPYDGSRHHICRVEKLTYPQSVLFPDPNVNTTIPIAYQCAGKDYDNFTAQMMEYIYEKELNNSMPLWGKREYPLPNNVNVLALGNSHTRQLLHEFVCMYGHKIVAAQNKYVDNAPDYGLTQRIAFDNNSTLTIIINTPLFYPKLLWAQLLEQNLVDSFNNNGTNGTTNYNMTMNNATTTTTTMNQTEYYFQDYDAIILGQFNTHGRKQVTNFKRRMDAFFGKYPYMLADGYNGHGPIISDIANVYNNRGPIISVPVFAREVAKANPEHAQIQFMKWRESEHPNNDHSSRIVFVPSREHIMKMGGIEAGTDNQYGVSKCNMRGWNAGVMHRCTGPKGGHPDMVSWDLIEALHATLTDDNDNHDYTATQHIQQQLMPSLLPPPVPVVATTASS